MTDFNLSISVCVCNLYAIYNVPCPFRIWLIMTLHNFLPFFFFAFSNFLTFYHPFLLIKWVTISIYFNVFCMFNSSVHLSSLCSPNISAISFFSMCIYSSKFSLFFCFVKTKFPWLKPASTI